MVNLRKPNAMHLVEGTYRKDRHAPDPSLTPLDTTRPKHLPDDALPAWEELCSAGEGVFANSDRITVEVTAVVMTRVRGGESQAGMVALLVKMLKSLGLSPEGRRGVERLTLPKPDGPFAKFLRPPA